MMTTAPRFSGRKACLLSGLAHLFLSIHWRMKMPRAPRNSSLETKLAIRRKVCPDTGCHEYNGSRDGKNYGSLHHRGKSHRAHRAAYALYVGPIPEGLHVLHKCDNPPCFNPDHLFLGTNGENMADMRAKNRQAKGGTKANSFLADEQVVEIRQRYAEDELSATKLAKEYGFADRGCITAIVTGRRYPHLGGPRTHSKKVVITPEIVAVIRDRAATGESASGIARDLGPSISCVCRIINRETYG